MTTNLKLKINQDIAIEGNLIKEIGETGTIEADPKTEVIEADGLLAIPGLINTHAHVPMVLLRNLAEDVTIESWFNDYIWPMESNLTAEDVYWGAMLGHGGNDRKWDHDCRRPLFLYG